MDETRVMLSILDSMKVLISKYNKRDYRGSRVKYITVTIIEYISSASRYLNPIIIVGLNVTTKGALPFS